MKHRRGSFECVFIQLSASGEPVETTIWSGLQKGPPRKLKFPSDTDLNRITSQLNQLF
ncbi:selenoprotein H-like protein [Dinothrombium tinctorium]|uniref:Selenoprotein H-like protein n=1 Tax=Dinothrombium tinctorium TaxID=1965070 RepID=A0A3S3PC69_9ACAR|nr:selenoprotein H-like protein [Dinothrombium tinctorium]